MQQEVPQIAGRTELIIRLRAEGAQEGDKAMEGAGLGNGEALIADHVHLQLQRCRECRVIPDGVDEYVADRFERPVAVASLEESPVKAGAQESLGDPGDCLEVEPVDLIHEHLLRGLLKARLKLNRWRHIGEGTRPCCGEAHEFLVGFCCRRLQAFVGHPGDALGGDIGDGA